MRVRLLGAMALGLVLAGCLQPQTEFHGSAFFPGGVRSCRAVCARDGLEMSSFIYTGRFATSCVCRPRPAASPASARGDGDVDVAATTARIEAQRRKDPRQPHAPAPGSE